MLLPCLTTEGRTRCWSRQVGIKAYGNWRLREPSRLAEDGAVTPDRHLSDCRDPDGAMVGQQRRDDKSNESRGRDSLCRQHRQTSAWNADRRIAVHFPERQDALAPTDKRRSSEVESGRLRKVRCCVPIFDLSGARRTVNPQRWKSLHSLRFTLPDHSGPVAKSTSRIRQFSTHSRS